MAWRSNDSKSHSIVSFTAQTPAALAEILEPTSPPRRRRRQRGQGLTEFALVLPVLLLTFLGLVEAGMLMIGVSGTAFGTNEMAKVLASEGNANTADQDGLAALRTRSLLGSTSIVQINFIDVYRLNADSNGNLSADTNGCAGSACRNRYNLDGTLCCGTTTVPWPSGVRNVTAYGADYVGVDVNMTYKWFDGLLGRVLPPVTVTRTAWVKLEPQTY